MPKQASDNSVKRDSRMRASRDAIDSLVSRYETVQAAEVGQILHRNADRSGRQAEALREDDQLIGFLVESQYHFPTFQFDRESGRIKDLVLYANKKLGASKDPYGALSWWETPIRMAEAQSPLDLLLAGKLSEKLVDNAFRALQMGM